MFPSLQCVCLLSFAKLVLQPSANPERGCYIGFYRVVGLDECFLHSANWSL